MRSGLVLGVAVRTSTVTTNATTGTSLTVDNPVPTVTSLAPAATLIGSGRSEERVPLTTRLEFLDFRHSGTHQHPHSSMSWVPVEAIAVHGPVPDNWPET